MRDTRSGVAIYGAGGFGREVAFLLEGLPRPVLGFVDDADPSAFWSLDTLRDRYGACAVALGVGDSALRAAMAERIARTGHRLCTLVDASARVGRTVSLGAGAIVCAGATLTVDIAIGCGAQVNLHCTIGHDCTLEEFATLSPGVHVSGHVHIGPHAYLGTGAVVLPGVTIGAHAKVGAGAVVRRDVPSGVTVVGVPAEIVRRRVRRTA